MVLAGVEYPLVSLKEQKDEKYYTSVCLWREEGRGEAVCTKVLTVFGLRFRHGHWRFQNQHVPNWSD